MLFIFHILTKKYPQEPQTQLQERLMVAYKSSFKKHNEVVVALTIILKKLSKNRLNINVVDLSKISKKFPEKLCVDSVLLAHRVVYIAPPKSDNNPIIINKALTGKDFYCVLFEHTVDKLPEFFDNHKIFHLFEDFDRFIAALDISECNPEICEDLKKKVQEAKLETEQYLKMGAVPKIVITDLEPQENDSLIS